jgi:Fe-S-cluster containining protein
VSDYEAPDYVHLFEPEVDRLVADDKEDMIFEECCFGKPMSSMRTRLDSCGNCRCVALEGTVGKQVSCTIYDIRPEVCRKFKPGSPVCRMARRVVFGVSDR